MSYKIVSVAAAALMFCGCHSTGSTEPQTGGASSSAQAEAKGPAAAPASAAPAAPAAAPAPAAGLKPESVDPDTPVPAGDLMAAYGAAPEAWNGKQVSVVGRYLNNAPTRSPSGKLISMGVNIALPETWKIAVICNSNEELPKDWATGEEGHVVKGTVKRAFSSGQVVLEPCECVK